MEILIAFSIFVVFAVLLFFVLRDTSDVWRRTDSRDDAVRQLLHARASLSHDFLNGAQAAGQYATAHVGPSLGSGFDGDALTFLTCDNGTGSWNVTSNGYSVLTSEVTYALWVPANVSSTYGFNFTGIADSNGYEQSCPFKWLLRRVDPAPAAAPPSTEPQILTSWWSPPGPPYMPQPSLFTSTATQQNVATLMGFRVLSSGPQWVIELKATAVSQAQREVGVGTYPLGTSHYTVVQQVEFPSHN